MENGSKIDLFGTPATFVSHDSLFQPLIEAARRGDETAIAEAKAKLITFIGEQFQIRDWHMQETQMKDEFLKRKREDPTYTDVWVQPIGALRYIYKVEFWCTILEGEPVPTAN